MKVHGSNPVDKGGYYPSPDYGEMLRIREADPREVGIGLIRRIVRYGRPEVVLVAEEDGSIVGACVAAMRSGVCTIGIATKRGHGRAGRRLIREAGARLRAKGAMALLTLPEAGIMPGRSRS